jgi:DNA-directed RNA polymerase subunit RPC12/RpoP
MTSYKPHFACFKCRKTFKRRLLNDIQGGYNKDKIETPTKCPECGEIMADMGLDFESPKKNDIKGWNHITKLYKVGITFHSCGCTGPGYIPNNDEELIKHFSRIKEIYLEHQHFWARRKDDPETQSEISKDNHNNAAFLYRLPKEMKSGTKNKPKYDSVKAQKYWNEKVHEIENKIKIITNANSGS